MQHLWVRVRIASCRQHRKNRAYDASETQPQPEPQPEPSRWCKQILVSLTCRRRTPQRTKTTLRRRTPPTRSGSCLRGVRRSSTAVCACVRRSRFQRKRRAATSRGKHFKAVCVGRQREQGQTHWLRKAAATWMVEKCREKKEEGKTKTFASAEAALYFYNVLLTYYYTTS